MALLGQLVKEQAPRPYGADSLDLHLPPRGARNLTVDQLAASCHPFDRERQPALPGWRCRRQPVLEFDDHAGQFGHRISLHEVEYSPPTVFDSPKTDVQTLCHGTVFATGKDQLQHLAVLGRKPRKPLEELALPQVASHFLFAAG